MAKQFEVIVQKFGGSSVADPEKIKLVARFIKSCLEEHCCIVVVVSAMGNTTNELLGLAKRVAKNPSKRELDMLISCGERSSMALLAMALNDFGVTALSLTGSQSGIITDNNHSGAEIIAIQPQRVFDALKSHKVVIIAGFQGISENKEITTLRRGGSDTTAVALASAINAQACEIYTDVAGVMDCDPKIVSNAAILPTITFDEMESMSLYGARVLAHDAIRLAKSLGITIKLKKTGEREVGTNIGHVQLARDDDKDMIAITHLRALLRITMPLNFFQDLKNSEGYFLCGVKRGDKMVAYISNDISQELIDKQGSGIDSGLALITLHLRKNHIAQMVLSKLSGLMANNDIVFEDLLISGNEIFVVIKDEQLNYALTIFHQDFLATGNKE